MLRVHILKAYQNQPFGASAKECATEFAASLGPAEQGDGDNEQLLWCIRNELVKALQFWTAKPEEEVDADRWRAVVTAGAYLNHILGTSADDLEELSSKFDQMHC